MTKSLNETKRKKKALLHKSNNGARSRMPKLAVLLTEKLWEMGKRLFYECTFRPVDTSVNQSSLRLPLFLLRGMSV